MADTYSTRYYNSNGTVKLPPPSASNLGQQAILINETIATAVTDANGDRHFLAPIPVAGVRELRRMLRKSGDMDTGGPTLDADIVLVWYLSGVEQTPVVLYDSSANSPFSAAVTALEYFEMMVSLTPYLAADGQFVHLVFKTNTAATTPAAANLTLEITYQ
jgi:hypothetical protein